MTCLHFSRCEAARLGFWAVWSAAAVPVGFAKAIIEEGPIPLSGAKLLLHFVSAAVLNADKPSYPRRFDPRIWGQGANLFSYGAGLPRYNADDLLLT